MNSTTLSLENICIRCCKATMSLLLFSCGYMYASHKTCRSNQARRRFGGVHHTAGLGSHHWDLLPEPLRHPKRTLSAISNNTPDPEPLIYFGLSICGSTSAPDRSARHLSFRAWHNALKVRRCSGCQHALLCEVERRATVWTRPLSFAHHPQVAS